MFDITSLFAVGIGVVIGLIIFGLLSYVYMSIALMTIAKKTNTPNAWLAWIPIANLYLMTQISETPWWTFFAFLLPLIPFVGAIAMSAMMVFWWWKIAERRNYPGWYAILMLIPFANFIIIGIIAWSKK